MQILNKTRNSIIAVKAVIADSFFSRMIGLLNRASLEDGEALVITRCNSIHMFFMRFAIDVIFIDQRSKIVGLVRNIKPFQLSKIYWNSASAIELPIGTIDRTQSALGDSLSLN